MVSRKEYTKQFKQGAGRLARRPDQGLLHHSNRGRGLPFLVVGIFAGAVSQLARLTWLRRSIQVLSGAALLFVGYYYARVFVNLL
ncbi:hypothetical protein BH24BAC1_BH24BAC1_27470 [soil metagenome]